MKVRIGLNGFGRTGRAFLRSLLERKEKREIPEDYNVVAINDAFLNAEHMAYLFKYDTVYGRFKGIVTWEKNFLIINQHKIQVYQFKKPEQIPWKQQNVNYVIEATGMFTKLEDGRKHLTAGAKRVIITSNSDAPMFIVGVNEEKWNPKNPVFAAANEEANAFLPLAKILHEKVGLDGAVITSIHSLTRTQNTVDGPTEMDPSKNMRKGRSAFNVIPQKLPLEDVICQVFPDIKEKVTTLQFNVPIINVSTLDVTFHLKKPVTLQDIERMIMEEKKKKKKLFDITKDFNVSCDFIEEPFSAIWDVKSSLVTGDGKILKMVLWYDNEVGYSNRLLDLIEHTCKVSDD